MKDQNTPSLIERYLKLVEEIKEQAVKCHRNPQDIALVAISKTRPGSEIQSLYNVGQRFFGENRVQELVVKVAEAPADTEWHFIGPLQRNKVRKVITLSSLIHSVDSVELARKISQCSLEASVTTRILLQVNVSEESTKQGMSVVECKAACDSILAFPGITIEGLMTMAPMVEDQSIIHACFAGLRELREDLKQRYGVNTFPHLSMGMSHDYRIAIAEGATLLRIGTALFKL